ncbi:hypothetical protein [Microbacterium sp. PMB16]|uniref:hypothetical protein n=1 Tax=Microbacterium sp. PMB16 TaxID=3120157 RepID=UPI003F4BEB0D
MAAILNDRELVINRGDADGVKVGMIFSVLNRKGIDILDPETREPLGDIEWPKVQVKVVRVDPGLCVARTFKKVQVGGGTLADAFGALSRSTYSPRRTAVQTFAADDFAFRDIDSAKSYVQVGDVAVQVPEAEEPDPEH